MFLVFNALMTGMRQYLIIHTGNRVDAVLATSVFRHLFRLPLPYFEHRPTGGVVDGEEPAQRDTVAVVGSGLIGATAWNMIAWARGVPSSSGHALVGGLTGAALVEGGPELGAANDRQQRGKDGGCVVFAGDHELVLGRVVGGNDRRRHTEDRQRHQPEPLRSRTDHE